MGLDLFRRFSPDMFTKKVVAAAEQAAAENVVTRYGSARWQGMFSFYRPQNPRVEIVVQTNAEGELASLGDIPNAVTVRKNGKYIFGQDPQGRVYNDGNGSPLTRREANRALQETVKTIEELPPFTP